MLAAIPGMYSSSSLNRRGPASSLDDQQGPSVPDTHESVGEWGGRALAYLELLFAHRRTVSESIGHIPVK